MNLKAAWRALWREGPNLGPRAGKASGVGALIAFGAVGQPVWTERRFERFAEEGYRRNVIAYRCVTEIARAIGATTWLLTERTGATTRELETHPLLALIARPNPLQSGPALIEALIGHLLIAGNGYLEAVAPKGRPPIELYALRPDRMRIVPGATGLPAAYRYTVDGRSRDFAVDQVTGRSSILHVKAFHPLDDWYGMSAVEPAAYAIDQHNQAGAWNQALLQNGARPSGALVLRADAGGLTDEQVERLRRDIDEQYAGAANAGRPLLLEGGLDWRELSLSPKDMDFVAGRQQAARDIALAFGVPPMLLGIPGDNTYANLREARLAFWEQTILPLIELIAHELGAWLGPRFGEDLRLSPDLDEISALSLRRERLWAKVAGADFLTVNEQRAACGYAPVAGGDGAPARIVNGGRDRVPFQPPVGAGLSG
ncbi:MAG: phage portal protein [Alphaproteobacteria bacterium]